MEFYLTNGTYLQMSADPDYLAFVEGLDALPEALPSAEVAGSSGQPPGPQVTALMAYLQEKHSLKKKAPVAIVSRSKADLKTGRVSPKLAIQLIVLPCGKVR